MEKKPYGQPWIEFNPAVQMPGLPTIGGTRLGVETVGEIIWRGDDPTARSWYHPLSRLSVLVACWYLGRFGSRRWQKRWGTWADKADGALWQQSTGEWRKLSYPPNKEMAS